MRLACRDSAFGRRPFQMLVRDQPLGTVCRSLCDFMSPASKAFEWQEVRSGRSRRWELVESSVARSARLRREAKLIAERRARLIDELRTAVQLSMLAPAQLEGFRQEYPWQVFWAPDTRRSFGLWASLSQSQVDRVLKGDSVLLEYDELTPGQREWLTQIAGSTSMGFAISPNDLPHTTYNPRRDLAKTRLAARLAGDPSRPGVQVRISLLPNAIMGWPNLLALPRVPAKERPPWLRAAVAPEDRLREARRERWRKLAVSDPDLRAEVTLRAWSLEPGRTRGAAPVRMATDFPRALAQIADRTELSILGDYDPCWVDYYAARDVFGVESMGAIWLARDLIQMPLHEVLSNLEERFNITLEKKGRFLWVRSERIPFAEKDGIDLLFDPRAPRRSPAGRPA